MMTFEDLQVAFNRAFSLTFSKMKLFMTFVVMAVCGLLVVFFRGLAVGASDWVILSLTLMPFFLCSGVLLSLGILLIRIYHNEVKGKTVQYRDILVSSWDVMVSALYFVVPVILSYLLLWILLGFFILLRQTPGIGEVIGVLLAFAPFIINVCILALCALNIGVLFFLTPIVALKGVNRIQVSQVLDKRIKGNVFANVVLALTSIFPLVVVGSLLIGAALLTGNVCYVCQDSLHHVIQWFFMMIPFTAILAPAVVFFFHFAAEAHIFFQKQKSQTY